MGLGAINLNLCLKRRSWWIILLRREFYELETIVLFTWFDIIRPVASVIVFPLPLSELEQVLEELVKGSKLKGNIEEYVKP